MFYDMNYLVVAKKAVNRDVTDMVESQQKKAPSSHKPVFGQYDTAADQEAEFIVASILRSNIFSEL